MYPDNIRDLLIADFKEYVEARHAYYTACTDKEKIALELKNSGEISGRIQLITFI